MSAHPDPTNGGLPADSSLYRRLLGDGFDVLPEVLRRFHGQVDGGTASGLMRVTNGKARICDLAAKLVRLPRAGHRVPVRVHVVVIGDRERWVRDFDGVRVETRQWLRRGLLIEASGPLRVGFRVVPSREGLQIESARSWLGALPLPAALAPRVQAVVTAADGDASWKVCVCVVAPLLGLLIAYDGEMTPLQS